MRKQTLEIDKRIQGIDLSIREKAKQNEEAMKKQGQEIEEGMMKQTQEIDQRLARLEKLILDMNTKLSHNN